MLMYISEDDEGAPHFPGGNSALVIPGRLDHSTRNPRGSPSAALGGAPSGAPVPTIVRVCPSRKKKASEAPLFPDVFGADGAPHQGRSPDSFG